MTDRLKLNALQQALQANNSSYGEAMPPSLLQDIFADWTHGKASDEEMVAALLPLKGQPALLRIQILAQASNLGQLLVARSEESLNAEEEETLAHLEALEEMAQEEGSTPPLEAGREALNLHLKAIHTLFDAAESGDAASYLKCLELAEEAASKLFKAQTLVNEHET